MRIVPKKYRAWREDRQQNRMIVAAGEKRSVQYLGNQKSWAQLFKSWAMSPIVASRKTVVFGCIRLLVNTMSSLPLNVMQKLPEGGSRVASDHPLQKILHRQPNKSMTTVEYNQFVNRMILEKGNCFVFKSVANGQIQALIPLVGAMEIRFDKDSMGRATGTFKYHYTPNSGGGTQIFQEWEILHFRYMSKDGIVGQSPIEAAADIISNEAKLQDYSSKYFENGANVGALIEMLVPEAGGKNNGLANDPVRQSYQEEIDHAWSGNDNAHKAVIVPYELKVNKIVNNPAESQALESRQFTAKYIAGVVFGVPAFKFNLSEPKYANAGEGNNDYHKETVTPLAVLQESRMDVSLLSEEDRDAGYFIKYNLAALLRSDPKTRAEVYKILIGSGIITSNEARNKEDLPSLPGGDDIWVQMQMVPRTSQLKIMSGDDGSRSDEWQNVSLKRLLAASPELAAEVRAFLGNEIRATGGQRVRNRIRKQFWPMFDKVAQRTVNKETQALNKQINKFIKTGDEAAFRAWIEEFYAKYIDEIAANYKPVVNGYSESIQVAALAEAGVDELEDEAAFQERVDAYIAGIAARWVNSSVGQLDSILEDPETETAEETGAALRERSDEWHENRADKVTRREIVTGDSSFAIAAWVLVGVTRKKWITQGDPCPFCLPMDGKTVSITSNFVQKGTVLTDPDGNKDNMTVGRSTRHPQLHGG